MISQPLARLVILFIAGMTISAPVAGAVPANQAVVDTSPSAMQTDSAEGTLSLNESQVNTTTGDAFWVAVRYDATTETNDTAVYGAEFSVEFNPEYLRATTIQNGSYLTQDGTGILVPFSELNNESGAVTYAVTSKGDTSGVTGTGDVAYIRFETTDAAPNQTAAQQSLSFSGVQVSDPSGSEIPTVTESSTVQLNVQPQSTFVVTPTEPRVGETVQLDATETVDVDGTIEEYQWDLTGDQKFDDATGQQVNTTFDTAGTANVSLRTIDDQGAVNTSTQEIAVEQQRVQLNVTANRTRLRVNSTVRFNTTRTDSGERVNATISVENESAFTGEDGTIVASPPESGEFEITASKDATATTAFANDSVVVEVFDNVPPTASFSIQPEKPEVGDTIVLNASSSMDEDGDIVRYRWDLDGDGAFDDAEGERVSVQANSTGERVFRLAVTDSDGAIDAREGSVTVVEPRVNIRLEPTTANVLAGNNRTFDVVVSGADENISSYQTNISLSNGSVASITDIQLRGDPQLSDSTISSDGSSASISAANTQFSDTTPEVTVATVTIAGDTDGETNMTLSEVSVGDTDGSNYVIDTIGNSSVTVREGPPALTENFNRPRDPDGDGVYEDINGQGGVDVVDVVALFNNLDNEGVQNNPAAFNINGEAGVDVVDVVALFQEVS